MYKIYLLLWCSMAIQIEAHLINDRYCLDTLRACIKLSPELEQKFDKLVRKNTVISKREFVNTVQLPLFRVYPELSTKIAHYSLGNFPTPIEHLSALGDYCKKPYMYMKRDDKSSGKTASGRYCFGGNKVRKLEFLLADAYAHQAQTILTFGCVGSNHVVATIDYAQLLGLKTIAMLMPQPNAYVVRRNLYRMYMLGARMYYAPTWEAREEQALDVVTAYQNEHAEFPYVIPVGGSNTIGTLGYVNAVFELKEQIEAGVMPEPDYIYVTVGSCGTFAGLLLGVRLAALKTKVIGVCIYPDKNDSFAQDTLRLVREANQLLHKHDKKVRIFSWRKNDITLLRGFEGTRYGVFSPEGVAAAQLLKRTQGIHLDGIYTGKAFAGMLEDIKNLSRKSIILFWHTFYADGLNDQKKYDYQQLPLCFHTYFESPVQELDNY